MLTRFTMPNKDVCQFTRRMGYILIYLHIKTKKQLSIYNNECV